MGRKKKTIVEYRKYDFVSDMAPVIALTGDGWNLPETPSEKLHFHNCLEIGICQKGRGVLRFMDVEWKVHEGDIVVISGDIAHTTFSEKGNVSGWNWVFVDIEILLQQYFGLGNLPKVSAYTDLMYGTRLLIQQNEALGIYGMLREILLEAIQEHPDTQVCVNSWMFLVLVKLTRYMRTINLAPVRDMIPISPALRYIQKNYVEQFGMEKLATMCSLSPAQFRRLFLQTMGMTPLSYLNQLRITKACNLLRTSKDSILVIAERVGFRSLSTFNRQFLYCKGVTPTVWRNEKNQSQRIEVENEYGFMVPPKGLIRIEDTK